MVSRTTDAGNIDVSVPLPDPKAGVEPEPYQKHFNKDRPVSKMEDPCKKAAKASLDCMERHAFDRDECLEYFKAYRECKKTWMAQRKADRQAGKPVY